MSEVGVPVRMAAVVVASFLGGMLTSFAQGWLPHALEPLANSPSGWTLLTVVVVRLARLDVRWSCVAGAAAFVALVLGYTAASHLRGLSYDPVLFAVVGLVVGPFVGGATAWLRASGWRPHAGAGLLAGICLGDATYGLVVVRATTGWFYWTLVGVLGLALLIAVAVRRSGSVRVVGSGPAVAVLVAALFFAAYSTLGGAAL